jgi:4-methyl-5(b-hydroxyethyl)-thiazole monophosphate biosynthesis
MIFLRMAMMVALSLASCPLLIGLRVASASSGRASVAASRRGVVQYLRTAARNLGTTAETGTKNGKKKSVLIPIAKGSEELETITISDTLVRAGVDVKIVSVSNDLNVVCSRGAVIRAQEHIGDVKSETFDMIVCPGGMPGAANLYESPALRELLLRHNRDQKYLGAICAAPAVVFAPLGLLNKKRATCYPAKQFLDAIIKHEGELCQPIDDASVTRNMDSSSFSNVVVDGNIITSRGPGTALAFALKLAQLLCGDDVCKKVSDEMLVPELYHEQIAWKAVGQNSS